MSRYPLNRADTERLAAEDDMRHVVFVSLSANVMVDVDIGRGSHQPYDCPSRLRLFAVFSWRFGYLEVWMS